MKNEIVNTGALIVERINWFDKNRYPNISARTATVQGTHAEILKRYRGVEGNAWPLDVVDACIDLHEGLASLDQVNTVAKYFETLRNQSENVVDFIVCGRGSDLPTIPGFTFCGFDYGYITCETNSYSLVFNEIVYGFNQDLVLFASRLNEHLLLGSLEDVSQVQISRMKLLNAGQNLEDDEEMTPLAIYSRQLGPALKN